MGKQQLKETPILICVLYLFDLFIDFLIFIFEQWLFLQPTQKQNHSEARC